MSNSELAIQLQRMARSIKLCTVDERVSFLREAARRLTEEPVDG